MNMSKRLKIGIACAALAVVAVLCTVAVLVFTGDCNHTFGEWEQLKASGCSDVGMQQRVCSACGETEKEEIPAKGHAWVDATCTEKKHCTACGATEGEALAHVWLNANCTEAKRCSVCSATEGEALGHTLEDVAEKAPTCEKEGYSAHKKCSVCDYTTEYETVAASGHTGGEATCTIGALCSVCGKEYGESAAHSYEESVVAPTCEAKGYTAHTCSVCGDEYTDAEVDSLGHKGGTATCTDKATCTVCGREYGDAPSHKWNDGVVTTAAGCESAGVKTLSCTVCTETRTERIPATGHDYDDVVTAPRCVASGYTTHTCTSCGDSYTDTPTSAMGHDYGARAATCASDRRCLREGCEHTEVALSHEYELVNTVAATCTAAKKLVYSCKGEGCEAGYEITEGDPLGHDYNNAAPVYRSVNAENCEFVSVYSCNRCSAEKESEPFERHSYTASIVAEADCVSVGTKKYQCSNCADSYTEDIPVNGSHDWDDGVLEGNKRTYTCNAEGCNETKTVIDASAEQNTNLNSGDLAGSGEVALKDASINLGAIADDIADKDVNLSAGTLEGEELEAAKGTLSDEQLAQIGENPIYNFTITDINDPDNNIGQFGDKFVTVTIPYVLSDGEDVDSIYIWFINDHGEVEAIKADYANGYVSFETNHFSYYTVTRLTPAQRCEQFGHQERILETVEVTCISDGYTLVRCFRCAETFKRDVASATGHDLTTVDTPATCAEAGVHKVSCSACDYKVEEITPAAGHDYDVEETPATCAEAGLKAYTCHCGHSYEEKTPQLDHEYEDSVTLPTCDTVGYTLHECKNCDHSYKDSRAAALGHDIECSFTWAEDHKKATATVSCKNGCGFSESAEVNADVKTFDGGCGNTTIEYTVKHTYNGETFTDKYTEEGEGKGHDLKDKYTHNEHEHWIGCRGCGIKHELAAHEWDEGTVISAPTCTKDGRIKYTCYCGRSVTEKIEASGHAWADATCIAPKTCTGCGETEGKSVGHDWKEATAETPKTCNTCGAVDGDVHKHAWVDATCTSAKYCSTCNKTDGDPLGHDFAAATCTSARICKTCGASEGKALGHSFADATCTEPKICKVCNATDGVANGHDYADATCTSAKTCKVCGVTDGEPLGHKYEAAVTAPTCTADGYTTYTCSVCNDTYNSNEVKALGHDYADATCTAARTCKVCGETDGVANGHAWVDATCTAAKYCSVCDVKEGEALGHDFAEANCVAPKTCKSCGVTEGDPLGHDWKPATTMAPMTCNTCGATVGDVHKHTWVDATCTTAKYCSTCNEVEGAALGHAWVNATCTEARYCSVCGLVDGSALGHKYEASVTAPTCTEVGYTVYTCFCGSSYKDNEVAALGHSFADATCTAAKTCKVCGVTDGAPLGHKYVATVTAPTCTAGGYTTNVCSVCSDSYTDNETPALGHDYAAATCTVAKTCKVCGVTDGAPLGHKYEAAVTAPTCTAGGYTTYTCSVCGSSYVDSAIPALGHSFANATCTVAKTCKVCGVTEGEALGHKYEAAVTAPTCTAGGYTTYTCSACADSYVDSETPALDHEFVYETIAPTCTADGKTVGDCTRCDATNVTVIPAEGHSFADATCTAPKTCTVCGETDGEALDHTYDAEITAPTCSAGGYTTYTCSACGDSYIDDETEATGEHTYEDGACTQCGAEEPPIADDECDHTELHEGSVSFEDYGMCPGVMNYRACDCGEVIVTDPESFETGFECDFVMGNTKTETDENGNMVMTVRGVCAVCGAVVDGRATVTGTACVQIVTMSYTFSIDGEVVLKDITASMESGSHREGETVKVDLTEYGVCCGTYLEIVYCACGELSVIEDTDANFKDFETKEYVDENGVAHQTMIGACSDCGFTVVMDQSLEIDGCVTTTTRSAKVFIGDHVFYDSVMDQRVDEEHDFETTVTMLGDTCEDGIKISYECKNCGMTMNSTRYGHELFDVEKIDLTEYGVCGNDSYISIRECPCGQQKGVSVNRGCNSNGGIGSMGRPDENGNMHYSELWSCKDCGIRYTRDYYTVNKGCDVTSYNTVSVSVGDTVVLDGYEYSTSYKNHTYVYEYTLKGESCEDGYDFVATCVFCDESYSGSSFGHNANLVGYYDLEELGACKGSSVRMYSCACGQNTWTNRNTGNCSFIYDSSSYVDEDGYTHSVQTETCMKCGLIAVIDSYSVIEGCDETTYRSYIYSVNGVPVADGITGVTKGERHNYQYSFELLDKKSCDGGVVMSAVCTACGDSYSDEYTGHRTYETRYDLEEYGACSGYIDTYKCACGENQGLHNMSECAFRWRTEFYTDDNGIKHEVQNRTCDKCGLVFYVDLYSVKSGCYIITYSNVTVSIGDTVILENYEYESKKDDHKYSYTFELNGDSCNDGYSYYATCQVCGSSYSGNSAGHGVYPSAVYDLSEHTACGGRVEINSCACGYRSEANLFFGCKLNWTSNQYIDDAGRRVYVESASCGICGLKYQNSRYDERDSKTCTSISYVTIMISVGDKMVVSVDYTNTLESHDYEVTATLMKGAETCEDGVIISNVCRDCKISYENTEYHHYSYEQERIELDDYGSVCHGYASLIGCACGENKRVSLDNALCDFDQVNIPCWINDAVASGWYSSTNGQNNLWLNNEAWSYTCAVTDPEKCGLTIRQARYWLAEENCTAYEYVTWQFGYNEETGEALYEITFKTGGKQQYHNYEYTELDSKVEDGMTVYESLAVCTDCEGYHSTKKYYDESGIYVKSVFVAENFADNGFNKLYEETDVRVRFSCCDRSTWESGCEYIRYITADGKEKNRSHTVEYEYCEIEGLGHGHKFTTRHEYESGSFDGSETVQIHYQYTDAYGNIQSCWPIVSEYRIESNGYWEKREYTYKDGNVCHATVSYTDSNGRKEVYEQDSHPSYNRGTIIPETCTQDGIYGNKCYVCGGIFDTQTITPIEHNWVSSDGKLFFCAICGLESENGASGDIVLEDLTEKYGNDENYVIGYYNRGNVEFVYNVSLVLRDGSENVVELDFFEFNKLEDPRAISFSRSAVAALAEALGYSEEDYYVRFAFVPVGADGSFDYAITLTDDEKPEIPDDIVVSDDTTLVRYIGNGEEMIITVIPKYDSVWMFEAEKLSGDVQAQLFDSEGNRIDGMSGNYLAMKVSLVEGEEYQLRIRWASKDIEGYIDLVLTAYH